MGVKQVNTKDEFDQELKNAGNKVVVVDFFATWCGPCKMISPKLEKMSEEMADVVFLKVDVDDNSEVAEEQEISAMPTFILFRNCKRVDQFVGANEVKLCEKIEEVRKGSTQQQQQ